MNRSDFINNQLPQSIKSTDSYMQEFLEAYYEWLDENSFQRESDLKGNLQKFQDYLFYQYLPNIPKEILFDKDLLIKHAKEMYAERGTEQSFNFLFKILFGEKPTILYPRKMIFRTSDAERIQESVVFCESSEDIDKNSKFSLRTNGREQFLEVTNVRKIRDQVYQIRFRKRKLKLDFTTTVLLIDDVQKPIINTTDSLVVVSPGRLFARGEVYSIQLPDGSFLKVKVDNTVGQGGIQKLSIVEHPINPSRQTFSIQPRVEFQRSPDLRFEIVDILQLNEEQSTEFIGDYMFVNKQDYVEFDYFLDNGYAGTVLAEFEDVTRVPPDVETRNNIAQVRLIPTLVGNFQGYYADYTGTSNYSVLQDNFYYQEFSYVIRSTIDRLKYIKEVNNNLHPAGYMAFSDFSIESTLDANVIAESTRYYLEIVLQDSFTPVDFQSRNPQKNFVEELVSTDVDTTHFYKNLTEEIITEESISKFVFKPFYDSVSSPDIKYTSVFKTFLEELTVADTDRIHFYKNAFETMLTTDTGGIAGGPFYVGNPLDGDEFQQRYWEYGYLEKEYAF